MKNFRLLFTGLGAFILSSLSLPANACASESELEWFCPGTQLTEVQPIFPPCSDVATSVTFVVSSVNPVISYSISGGTPQSNPVFSNIPSGNYTLDLIVAPDCAVSFPFTISNPGAPFFVEVSQRDVSCTGNNGIIDFEVAGGTAPYDYFMEYSNGMVYPLPSDSLGGFFPGTYTVIVEDANGCEIDTTITLLSYSFPVIGQTIVTPASCGVSNGSIQILLANPPVGVYTISYSINGGFNYQSSNTFNNLPPGNYPVYVAVNGCLSNMGLPLLVTIPENSGIVVSNVATTPTNCNGNTGSIAITAAAGASPLLYSINGGQTFSSNPVFTNLAAGTYNIVVLNTSNNCDDALTATISAATPPTITSIQPIPPACNLSNGQLTIQASTSGPGTLVYSIDNGQTFSSNPTFTGLGSGAYNIVVQNQLTGCVQTTNFVMPSQSGPVITAVQVTAANCVLDNGTLFIQAQGAAGSLLYSINGGSTYSNNPNFTNLAEGSYAISVQNSVNGCISSTTAVVGAIGSPQITAVNVTNLTCTSSVGQVFIQATTSGGGALQYSLNGGVSSQSNPLFQNLVAGNYTVTVTDQQNCSSFSSFSLVPPESPVFTSVEVEDASCIINDGVIEFEVAGGNQPYSYSIEFNGQGIFPVGQDSVAGFTAGTYQIFAEDADGCVTDTTVTILAYNFPLIGTVNAVQPDCNTSNGSIEIVIANPPPANSSYAINYTINGGINWQSSNVFNNLAPGQYTIFIAVEGCLSNGGFPLFFTLEENNSLPALDISVLPTDCSTDNGVITFVNAGNSDLIYSIDGGVNFSTSTNFSNLPAGTYAVSVENPLDGCDFDTTILVETLEDPIITDLQVTEADCGIDNGVIAVQAIDPNGSALTYSINTSANAQPNGLFTPLEPGNYTVSVINEAGCAVAITATIPDNTIPTVNAGPDQEICAGNSTTLSAITAQGNAVNWTNNVTNGVGFVPLSTDNYLVTATAPNGCSASDEVTIVVNEPILPTLAVTSQGDCFPITVTVNQNDATYSDCGWTFSNGFTGSNCGEITVSLTQGGCYDVVFTATDVNGCQVNYTENNAICLEPGPTANFIYTPGTVTTEDTPIQFINTSENAVSYSWELIDNQTSTEENPIISEQLLPGSYAIQLVAFDANGCTDTIVKIINVETEFSVFVPNSFTPDGDEINQEFLPILSPGYDPSQYTFIIFNRWGEIVFESRNPEIGWDGTYAGSMVPQGIYTFQLFVKSIDNAEVFQYTGHVNVLR